MGDLIHTLPALTDAGHAIPGIEFDWMVEEGFAEIPAWHPLVRKVIPVALRRWRKNIFARETWREIRAARARLQAKHYDVVLDAQALVKSAWLTWLAKKGERVGLNWSSARESLASLAYQRTCEVNFYQHATVRMRSLFSQALGYALPDTAPDFGLNRDRWVNQAGKERYLVFLHGTTWPSKQWPESDWAALAGMAARAGYRIKMSGGSDEEVARAQRIASLQPAVDVRPRLDIASMAALLANAEAAVAVDTGFGHLAAALGVPTVSIYGATNPQYTGALGARSVHVTAHFPCSPCLNRTCTYKGVSDVKPACYGTVPPVRVWEAVNRQLS